MHVPVASVNCVLNAKPSDSKKVMERWTSATGRLTNSLCDVAGRVPALVMTGDGAGVAVMGVSVGERWRKSADRVDKRSDARVAEVEAEPHQRGDVHGREDVAEQRVVETELRGHRAAEVGRPEDGPEHRR